MTSSQHAENVQDLLRLDALSAQTFRSRHSIANINGRVFGGQTMGQALWAAGQTVDGRLPTQLHYMFGSGASLDAPLDYAVETLQQGRRFSTRRVDVVQAGKRVGSATASFQVPTEGLQYFSAGPTAPDPETLPSLAELGASWGDRGGRPYLFGRHTMWADLRPFGLDALMTPSDHAHMRYWIRFNGPLVDDALLHCSTLALFSDAWLAFLGTTPHFGIHETERFYFSALSHSVFFHRPFRTDDWLLVDGVPLAAANGQGISLAKVFDRSRRQVATVSQSSLISEVETSKA